ncbi:hypothetical protein [Ureibacillus manganicus]|uniref:Uncharacterized protein n=1 Tax=Ureibacillus manganicus DSM 26584 TaxID=1384049 RepID=A0A0A3I5U7_9BACL|nr:hypothetical protein [Ureibacillus manganicus]KGR78875.1 hypothetical protein CD29_09375 [Ureibacillus manganicus DSM 26584]
MNNERSIWNELNELPRSEIKEKNTWETIDKKMRKTNREKSLVMGLVTAAVLWLLFILIGIGQNETLPIQTAHEQATLQAIYFVRDTDFEETKVKPSSLYSNVIAINDLHVLEHFEKYMDLLEPMEIEDPRPYIHDSIIIELLFKYDNGKTEHFKMFDEHTFYNIDTKQWYSIDSKLADNETRFAFYGSFTYSPSSWSLFIFLALAIGRAISDSIIKRMYLIRKLNYFEKNSAVKYIYYGLLTSLIIFTVLIGLYKLVIHYFWILLVFLMIGLFIIYLEKKYGDRKANFYSLIISTIFFICILCNIIINL